MTPLNRLHVYAPRDHANGSRAAPSSTVISGHSGTNLAAPQLWEGHPTAARPSFLESPQSSLKRLLKMSLAALIQTGLTSGTMRRNTMTLTCHGVADVNRDTGWQNGSHTKRTRFQKWISYTRNCMERTCTGSFRATPYHGVAQCSIARSENEKTYQT